ncbi:MAG: hypothetical protein HY534_05695 [Chloroflexi bacterium]|nr:hypothetical protein [Chloroflexota bacterium]
MPKRRQHYRRPARPITARDDGHSQEVLELAAVRLTANQTVEDLRLLVRQSRDLRDAADQYAVESPGAEALGRFREAQLRLAEAERALALAQQNSQAHLD